jgi:hypothetical protein
MLECNNVTITVRKIDNTLPSNIVLIGYNPNNIRHKDELFSNVEITERNVADAFNATYTD